MFYRINSSRVTLQEHSWGCPWIVWPIALPLAAILGLLRVRIPGSTDDPPVDELDPFEIDPNDIPQHIRQQMEPLELELEAQGFEQPVAHYIVDVTHATTLCWKTYIHRDGTTLARIHYRHWRGVNPARTHLFPILMTHFKDGTFLVTSGGKPDMLTPTNIRINHWRGAKLSELIVWHAQKLADFFGSPIDVMRGSADIRQTSNRYHESVRDFHLQRGVFCEPYEQVIELPRPSKKKTEILDNEDVFESDDVILDAEEENLFEEDGFEKSPPIADKFVLPERYAEVVAQLKLQQGKSSWGTAILLLIITGLMFAAAGAGQWDWKYIAILIPVLLFHELGHLVAMWIFRYRNLKMFFIPFLGAAVSGRNHNIAGWKKALVALAGPIPGIVVGATVGIIGAVIEQPVLIEIGSVTLFLNAFNLLPLMPLDGGWNLHATLFSRNPLLDATFRGIATLGCIGLAIIFNAKGLYYTAIWVGLGIGVAYRCGKIAAKLQKEGVTFSTTEDGSIPLDAVARIVDELQDSSTKLDNRTLAALTINVYETMNAKPPSVFATISLLVLHGTSFLFAAIVLCVLFVSKEGGLLNVAQLAANPPAHSVSCGSIETWRGTEFDLERATPHHTAILKLADENAARNLHQQLTGQLPQTAGLRRMSDLLFVSLNDDDQWPRHMVQLKRHDAQAIKAQPDGFVSVDLSFLAPTQDSANALEQELQEYFLVSSFGAIPPWQANDGRDPALREKHQIARRTYRWLLEIESEIHKDPALVTIQKQLRTAFRVQDQARIQQLKQQLKQQLQQLHQQVRQTKIENAKNDATRSSSDRPLDFELADAYVAYRQRSLDLHAENEQLLENAPKELLAEHRKKVNAEQQKLHMKFGQRFGQVPLTDGLPTKSSKRFTARYGFIQRGGFLFRGELSFEDAFDALPRIIEWLCEKNCQDLKFDVSIGQNIDAADDLEEND